MAGRVREKLEGFMSNAGRSLNDLLVNYGTPMGGSNVLPYKVPSFEQYQSQTPQQFSSVNGASSAVGGVPSYGGSLDFNLPTGGGGGGVSSNGLSSILSSLQAGQEEAARLARQEEEAAIGSEFKNIRRGLQSREEALRSEQPILEQEITQSFEKTLPEIQRARSERVGGLETAAEDIEKTGRGGIAQQRRLFNELLTGGQKFSGTSVGGAFGELLGRQTTQAVGQIQSEMARGIQDTQNEIGRVNEFYDQTINDLTQQKETALRRARNSFQNELNKIRDALNLAEDDKADRRLSALRNFQNNALQIREAADLKRYELEQWTQQRNQSLSSSLNFAVKSMQDYVPFLQTIQSNLALQGKELTPQGVQAATSHFFSGQGSYPGGLQVVGSDESFTAPLSAEQEALLSYEQDPEAQAFLGL
jgi:hypothetical protein